MNGATEEISKLKAAERQANTAIKMFFNNEDSLPTHTVVCASYQLLADLAKHRKVAPMWDELIEAIIEERRDEIRTILRKPQNFLKHADNDPDEILEYRSDALEFYIFVTCTMYQRLTDDRTPEMRGFLIWFYLRYPEISMNSEFHKKAAEYAQQFGKPDGNRGKRMALDVIEDLRVGAPD